jgi:predicted transcriptional regulator
MADSSGYRVALLSVHPEYAQAILDGTKTVEFRKRPLADDVTHVAIYATMPVGRVVGVFAVEEQVFAEPRSLWREFRKVAGISEEKFHAYYDGRDQGVGIKVSDLVTLPDQVTLEEAFGISRPPQSFQYFAPSEASASLQHALA